MTPLNLPQYNINVRATSDGTMQIFDSLRNKFLVLTPEEWVRQHFVSFLINHKGFPTGLMANEVSLTLNGTSRRSDTVVYNSSAQPLVIVEYKAPSVRITQKTFDQIVRYNMVFKAPYLIVSNGLNHYCCHIDLENHTYKFLPGIPNYDEL
ncbi:MAG: type I restriction enzyme HsdR N-terminal domain-containing protein [Muribaculaceae bacterium]|nr:type I restriction enzyme HsdR N-terminal domain-containing protein [Muribaculaceae bacterium]